MRDAQEATNAKLEYPWQELVFDAFMERHSENMPQKINVAERAISAILVDSTPLELVERVALGEVLLALWRLVREQSEFKDESDDNKEIA